MIKNCQASELETIQGEIKSILFQHKDSYVIRLKIDENEIVTILIGYGLLTGPKLYEGESIKAIGIYEYSFTHGDQFRCKTIIRKPISEAHLIIQWLAKSNEVQGVGAQTGKKLNATYKDKLVEILTEGDVEKINRESGISLIKVFALVSAWKRYREEINSVEFLVSFKFPYQLAMNCINAWGNNVELMLKSNPYHLCVFWGFTKVDPFVRDRWSIDKHDPRRITAFAEELLLSYYKSVGATAMTVNDLSLKMMKGLGVSVDALPHEQGRVIINQDGNYQAAGPFVMENYVMTRLAEIRDIKPKLKPCLDPKKLEEYEGLLQFKLNLKQKEAIECTVTNRVSIVRGGAGTGKTTVLKGIIAQYEGFSNLVILLAPTGKAALRMTEATGYHAETIARFISRARDKDCSDKFRGAVVLIDESSMVDLPTIYYLLTKLPNNITLIFVGDERQLAPVGPGLFFHQIVNKECWIPQVVLRETVRQCTTSGIPSVTDSILKYKVPNITPLEKLIKAGCAFREVVDTETCLNNAAKLYARLKQEDEDVQIILATRAGVAKLNNLAQILVNPLPREEFKTSSIEHRSGSRFIAGDKVVYNENNYRKGLTNGAMGTVIEVYVEPQLSTFEGDVVSHVMRVRFDDVANEEMESNVEDIYITAEEFNDEKISLAYAITCHKSQGSQYNTVIVVLDSDRLADNSWIYTAITRAKNTCYILGKETRLIKAVTSKSKAALRLTGLRYG